jgi:hypothetical protein
VTLFTVVTCLNLTHEVAIAQSTGLADYRKLQAGLPVVPEFLTKRNRILEDLLKVAGVG